MKTIKIGGWLLVLFLILTISQCLENPKPDYRIFAFVEEDAFNTVSVHKTIEISVASYLDLSNDLVFGPTAEGDAGEILWTSSNISIATVTRASVSTALVRGINPGTATITAKSANDSSSVQIKVINSSEMQITSTSGAKEGLDISPDGLRMTYTKDYRVQINSINGGQEQDLTGLAESSFSAKWSPDGEKIVFVAQSGFLYTIAASGGVPVQLTQIYAYEPTWSPDGSRIAFSSASRLYTISSTGGTPVAHTESKGESHSLYPAWSPDSKKIAYCYDDKLYVCNTETNTETLLVEGTVMSGWPTYNYRKTPGWTTDGRYIIYLKRSMDICMIPASGGPEEALAEWMSSINRLVLSQFENKVFFYMDFLDQFMVLDLDVFALYRLNCPDVPAVYRTLVSLATGPESNKLYFIITTDHPNSEVFSLNY